MLLGQPDLVDAEWEEQIEIKNTHISHIERAKVCNNPAKSHKPEYGMKRI